MTPRWSEHQERNSNSPRTGRSNKQAIIKEDFDQRKGEEIVRRKEIFQKRRTKNLSPKKNSQQSVENIDKSVQTVKEFEHNDKQNQTVKEVMDKRDEGNERKNKQENRVNTTSRAKEGNQCTFRKNYEGQSQKKPERKRTPTTRRKHEDSTLTGMHYGNRKLFIRI
jgi:hypothetical protein